MSEAGDVRGRRTEVKEKLPFPMNPNHRRQVKISQSLSLFKLLKNVAIDTVCLNDQLFSFQNYGKNK